MRSRVKKKPATARAVCAGCEGEKNHIIVASTEQRIDDKDGWWLGEYQIIRCLGCDNIAFRRITMYSEDVEPVEGGYQPTEQVSIFPDPASGRPPINDYFRLPKTLQGIYIETLKAINTSQPILAGIGIRAIVEMVCNDRKAKGKTLEMKIDDLVNQQTLTKTGAAVLHKIRTMGNKATHEVKPHSKQQLAIAIDVVNHLLLGVYILPKAVNETLEQ